MCSVDCGDQHMGTGQWNQIPRWRVRSALLSMTPGTLSVADSGHRGWIRPRHPILHLALVYSIRTWVQDGTVARYCADQVCVCAIRVEPDGAGAKETDQVQWRYKRPDLFWSGLKSDFHRAVEAAVYYRGMCNTGLRFHCILHPPWASSNHQDLERR